MTRASKPSTLRQLMDDGVKLSALFNAARSGIGHAVSDRLRTSQSSAATGEAKAGQVSAFGLRPVSLREKLQTLQRMIKNGKVALADGVSPERIVHEMKKAKNDGLSALEMVAKLAKKGLLKVAKVPVPVYKVPAPGL